MSGNDLRVLIAGVVVVFVIVASTILSLQHDAIPDLLVTLGIGAATVLGVIGVGIAASSGKNGSTH